MNVFYTSELFSSNPRLKEINSKSSEGIEPDLGRRIDVGRVNSGFPFNGFIEEKREEVTTEETPEVSDVTPENESVH